MDVVLSLLSPFLIDFQPHATAAILGVTEKYIAELTQSKFWHFRSLYLGRMRTNRLIQAPALNLEEF